MFKFHMMVLTYCMDNGNLEQEQRVGIDSIIEQDFYLAVNVS